MNAIISIATEKRCDAAWSGSDQLRRNFLEPVLFEGIFAVGRVALRHRSQPLAVADAGAFGMHRLAYKGVCTGEPFENLARIFRLLRLNDAIDPFDTCPNVCFTPHRRYPAYEQVGRWQRLRYEALI
jgi:hypothetical protein